MLLQCLPHPTHPANTHTPHPARPSRRPHSEHPKRAPIGMFWVFGTFLTHPAHPSSFGEHEHEKRVPGWLPSPHPQPLNIKNTPTTAHFQCSAASSSPPYVEHQERAHKGAFLVFGLFLTPPFTSSTPFGACSTCSTSSSPPLTSNTSNTPFWARSTCSA